MDNRDAFVAKLKAQLDDWNAELDQFEARARKARADQQAAYNQQLADLRRRRDDAQQRLMQLQQASAEAWDEIKRGADDAWAELASAFANARERLRDKAA